MDFKIMILWKAYFWFCVFNLVVNLVSGFLSDVQIIDAINWAALSFGLVGLRGYVFQIKYFSESFWKYFFTAFLLWSIAYLVLLWSGLPSQDQSMLVASIYGVLFAVLIPQFIALYRYGVKSKKSE